jgi:hypothetical protein
MIDRMRRRYVLADDIVRIIFEELDSKWLQSMWDGDGDMCVAR